MPPQSEILHLVGIPAELRLEIYHFLIDIKGHLIVYAGYEIAKEVDIQTLKLMHVNRLIRAEVQEFFYKNQTFEFRSTAAIDNFLNRIGQHNASLIKEVQLGFWMCARLKNEHIINLLGWLKGVDRLILMGIGARARSDEYVVHKHPDDYSIGNNALTIMHASSKLPKGKVWVSFNFRSWHTSAPTILFLPKDVDPSKAYNPPRSDPFSYIYPRQPISGFWEVYVPDESVTDNQDTSNNELSRSSKRRKIH